MPLIDLFPEYGVRELARLTGLSHGTISRVKRGLAADRQTMQTLYSVTGKCLCCDGIANLSPTVHPDPAPALGAEWMRRLAVLAGVEAVEGYWGEAKKPIDQRKYGGSGIAGSVKKSILAIPGPAPEQLLADALALEEVRSVMDTVENLIIAIGMGWDLDGVVDAANAALAKLKGDA